MKMSVTAALQAAALGAATGVRSQMGLAMLAQATAGGDLPKEARTVVPLTLLRLPRMAQLTGLAAVGELIGDKTPWVPARTEPLPFLGRIGFGALVGALAFQANGRDAAPGAAIGAFAGGTLAIAATKARLAIGEKTGIPDPIIGAIEDVVAFGVSALAVPRRAG